MRFSEVKERYIYYVSFDPVRYCEFNGNHLAVVLKKNKDKRTAIVMPLTSKENGIGVNKLSLGYISSLPQRLKGDKSYAVYDKVRSVNYDRFEPIFETKGGKDIINAKIDDDLFNKLIEIGTSHLEEKLLLDEKIELYRKKLRKVQNEKLVNLAYKIKKNEENNELVSSIRTEIEGILYNNIEYTFTETEKKHGIEKIINSIIANK
ncbi:type II toxin-antitoxin system PemK/MazF family toxin (plasmid) [Clostridium perfringens]|uniref:type II toxin-antitoxin system PemK/MazF family toxin n=1 Tax=Clostridium perfringens TaxID=1502 RepID=UPI001CB590E1|nr:type II toxin-antitoxin system PemK/MazF family toxin [Clostridium perfringens]MDM0561301.1 type II toxin-antitoxin system PemK/MazF family toxin [Clostridium perfringens]MDV5113554.1 type II toxin-antitoxin system PemK/MazF family toxin [Clostridium perfringens]HBI6911317.1 type II toxin-antitoxin system PemK/MazF family toxin [Clostridium perfringens]HBI6922987.1 type II toxin-antitoxin system PemK/MazF family toxin [Clostridium perfringens]